MSIPDADQVIAKLQIHLGIKLHRVSNKKIFYKGVGKDGNELLVCTPKSKLYPDGRGWVDITAIQKAMFEEAHTAILAFRVEGGKVYYLNFREMKPYLTDQSIINNKREGDHWKLYIWPDHIKVLGNEKKLTLTPGTFNNILRIPY